MNTFVYTHTQVKFPIVKYLFLVAPGFKPWVLGWYMQLSW